MDFLINYIFISLPEFYIIILWGAIAFGYRFYNVKYKILIMATIIALASDLMWMNNLFAELRIIITYLIIYLLYWKILKERWIRALFITMFIFISLVITESIIVTLIMQFITYEEMMNNLLLKFITTISYTLPLIIGIIFLWKKDISLREWLNKNLEDKKLTFYWINIIFLIFLQLFFIVYLNYSFYLNYFFIKDNNFSGSLFISVALIIINILLIYFIIKLMNYYKKEEIKQTESNYNKYLENLINKLRIERHDFVNEIQTINGLVQEKMYVQLEDYLKHLVSNIKKTNRSVQIKNVAVSALLLTKIEQFEANGVKFIIIVETKDSFDSIKSYDIVKIISNLIDNSYRAVYENSVDKPFIELYWGREDSMAIIEVSNNGPKIDSHTMNLIFKEGFTTKKNKENSGYGLSIVKSTINKYKGIIEIKSNEQITKFTIKLPL